MSEGTSQVRVRPWTGIETHQTTFTSLQIFTRPCDEFPFSNDERHQRIRHLIIYYGAEVSNYTSDAMCNRLEEICGDDCRTKIIESKWVRVGVNFHLASRWKICSHYSFILHYWIHLRLHCKMIILREAIIHIIAALTRVYISLVLGTDNCYVIRKENINGTDASKWRRYVGGHWTLDSCLEVYPITR